MKQQLNDTGLRSVTRSLALFTGIGLFVLFVNFPIIAFDMMYFEQPILYLVNQKIHSPYDLLQVYLHPAMLEALSIPFFRPSGHFLLYQIITLFVDWHHTRVFLAINFLFLALSCYMMITLYALLFPRYRVGGYIACGIYLMHPALMLSRLSPMHFEFASVFFLLLALYCFVLFCQKNKIESTAIDAISIRHLPLLLCSVLFYFISITFKETALMLGPVMALYLCIILYRKQPLLAYLQLLFRRREVRQIILLLAVVTITFVVYLSMAWSSLSHPLQPRLEPAQILADLGKLFKILFGFDVINTQADSLQSAILQWEIILFPPWTRGMLWLLLGCLLWSVGHLYFTRRHDKDAWLSSSKKSFLFLAGCVLVFMVMPIIWGRIRPWHLALSLVFASLLLGFCFEYVCQRVWRNTTVIQVAGMLTAGLLGLTTISVTAINTEYLKQTKTGFALELDRNAVLHMPLSKEQLNSESVLVVEDSLLHNDYLLGDSMYPYELYGANVDVTRILSLHGYYHFPYVYAGTLFKWAYLMPALQEQVYPFQVDKMQTISNLTIYNWLQHFNNIFCVGYDKNAVWHDRTMVFKKNLLLEKARRHLIVNQYQVLPTNTLDANSGKGIQLPFPYAEYCEFACDTNKSCQGFTYVSEINHGNKTAHCYFHTAMSVHKTKPCLACQQFMKS